jgi:hypothetical protein
VARARISTAVVRVVVVVCWRVDPSRDLSANCHNNTPTTPNATTNSTNDAPTSAQQSRGAGGGSTTRAGC